MGFLDGIFGKKPAEKRKKKVVSQQQPIVPIEDSKEDMTEVVAVIAAAVYQMMGTTDVALKITRGNNIWALAGRQQLMDRRGS
jgi:SepF-like predicted cell division protein (DUF552 family)